MRFRTGEGGVARFVAATFIFVGEQGFDRLQGCLISFIAGALNHDHQIAVFGGFQLWG
ncbi:hypothetical protein D3C75_1119710 [compost metagenome]